MRQLLRKFRASPARADKMVKTIEPRLRDELSKYLTSIEGDERYYALLLCWYDFSNLDDFRPTAVLGKDAIRSTNYGDWSRLWSPHNEFPDQVVERFLGQGLLEETARCYAAMCGEPEPFEGGLMFDDDDAQVEMLRPFREMLMRLAAELNQQTMPYPVTDDFVVVVAAWDNSHEEQFDRFVPAGKIRKLVEDGFWKPPENR